MAEVTDVESIKGRFGWITIEECDVLYITRIINGEHLKFISVLMAETHLLREHLQYFNPDIYKCLSVIGHNITNTEAKLLNKINLQHCECMFGIHKFIAGKDCIVCLEDAQELKKFLVACYNKIQSNINDQTIQFGFIKIGLYFIPYYIKEDQKYLPLFYFEGSTDDLLIGAVELKNWDLAYLKFCFQVMGVYDNLYDKDYCTVVSLNDVKKYYPPETTYEEFWPKNVSTERHVINHNKDHHKPGVWIKNCAQINHP
ncbi:uncharacterized protein LOC114130424 [Aphis gossypii]|nr:uncharacterized protein LOC114130424 [Aphis gossypii]